MVFDSIEPMRICYTRGGVIESLHKVHVAVVDTSGEIMARAGDENLVTFMRSTAKPFQTLPILQSGAAKEYGLTDEEIALICASHSGQPYHIRGVLSILGKFGLSEEDLQCGPHLPFDQDTSIAMIKSGVVPKAIHNNCSGKHAGMLGLAKYLGESTSFYRQMESKVQQMVLETISIITDVPTNAITVGIDGCGLPVFALSIKSMALAYARLAEDNYSGKLCRELASVRQSMQKYPRYVAGSDRKDTIFMEGFLGRLLCKEGAEGIWCAGLIKKGWGICLKVEDGSGRAMEPALLEVLLRLGVWHPIYDPVFVPYHRPDILNWSSDNVGKVVVHLD
jgi:L-asparaginase II